MACQICRFIPLRECFEDRNDAFLQPVTVDIGKIEIEEASRVSCGFLRIADDLQTRWRGEECKPLYREVFTSPCGRQGDGYEIFSVNICVERGEQPFLVVRKRALY